MLLNHPSGKFPYNTMTGYFFSLFSEVLSRVVMIERLSM